MLSLPSWRPPSNSVLKNRNTFSARAAAIKGFSFFSSDVYFALNDDMTINHDMIDKFHFWEDLSKDEKQKIIDKYTLNAKKSSFLLGYFENFLETLKKNTLNSYIKSVIKT